MKYLIFIVLLVALLLTAGCVSDNKKTVITPAPTPVPTTIIPTPTLCKNNCSGVCYDPGRQSCCYGTILTGKWKEVMAVSGDCYNESSSSMTDEWYCGGVLHHSGDGIFCCNGTAYNTKTHHCCGGLSVQAGPYEDYGNCGSTCYKYSEKTCCNYTTLFAGAHLTCCGRSTCPENQNCCNGVCFDYLKSSCCNGTIVSGYNRCCYQTTYYKSGGKMCPSGMRCCETKDGQVCYDPQKERCCLGTSGLCV